MPRKHRRRGSIVEVVKGQVFKVRVPIGTYRNGAPKHKTTTIYGPYRDAERFLTQELAKLDRGVRLASSKERLDSYLSEYLAVMRGSLRPKTFKEYEGQFRRYVLPFLGHKKLSDLRTQDIQNLYTKMSSCGLSASTVRLTHANLTKALKQAVNWGKINVNPCVGVVLPTKVHKEMRYFCEEDVKRFRGVIKGHRHELRFLVLLETGIRISEAQALRWGDVDLASKTVSIRRSAKKVDGQWFFNPPKTAKGQRSLMISNQLANYLREVPGRRKDALVFANADGEPFSERSFAECFYRIQKQAGVAPINLHGLRHTNATMLLRTIPLKVVSERLGHSSISVTADLYGHVTASMQKSAADVMGELIDDEDDGED